MGIDSAKNDLVKKLWSQLNTNGDKVIDKQDKLDKSIQKELGLDRGEVYDYARVEAEYEKIMARIKDKLPTGQKPSMEPTLTDAQNRQVSNASIINAKTDVDKIEKYGVTHYRYEDCDPSRLVKVGNAQVRDDCAKAFRKMQAAAQKEGLNLRIVSGYRSSQYQVNVFKRKFNGKMPTDRAMQNRLRESAPSGFSEHHTGLAIDINETEVSFKNTKEYRWLSQHAIDFGFEMSFPENNAQGLIFEPWHWRYVGKKGQDEANKEVFAQARNKDPRFNKDTAQM